MLLANLALLLACGTGATIDDGGTEPDAQDSCGNNIAQPGEVCDGSDLRGESCQSRGYTSGTLSCANSCNTFNETQCSASPVCGDGRIDGGEQCDGNNLNGLSCTSFEGYDGGTLSCSGCQLNLGGCTVDAPPQPQCIVSLCIAGAFTRSDGGNWMFEELCESLPGIIWECDTGTCWPMFDAFSPDDATAALIDALDTDGDGYVDDDDDECIVALAGYSWGGVNIVNKVATDFINSLDVSLSRSVVHRLVAIDPFQIGITGSPDLVVPYGVEKYWEYRHSTTPSGDCSSGAPLGPYRGLVPQCPTSTQCRDYDYSVGNAATELFYGPYQTQYGDEIGHCSIIDAATDAALTNLMSGQDGGNVPTSQSVARY